MLLGIEIHKNNEDIEKWVLIVQIVGNAFYTISSLSCLITYFCFYPGLKCPVYTKSTKSTKSTNTANAKDNSNPLIYNNHENDNHTSRNGCVYLIIGFLSATM